MPDSLSIGAPAKINLFLDVISKRADGYHNLETVMQTVGLRDRLGFKLIGKSNYFKIISDDPRLALDGRNLIAKAHAALKNRFSRIDGVFVDLKKNIPVAAGLGGGSSDCAAALIALNEMFALGLGHGELSETAAVIGADVPFFLTGGTCLAEGMGERISPAPKMPAAFIVLARPPVYISTGDVFSRFRPEGKKTARHTAGEFLSLLESGDLAAIGAGMYNALESVTEACHPVITEIKRKLREAGALGAMMSGSGPAVFGLFSSRPEAAAAADAIRESFGLKAVYVTDNSPPPRV